MRGRVTFDTCALGHLAASRIDPAVFEGVLGRRNLVLAHGPAILQMQTARNIEGVRQDMLWLRKLGFARADKLVDARSMSSKEAREGGLDGVRVYDGSPAHLFEPARDPERFEAYLRVKQPEWREIFEKNLTELHDSAREKWTATPKQRQRELASGLGGVEIAPTITSLEEDGFLRYVLNTAAGNETATKVAAAPRRYRTNLANAALLTTYMIANLMGSWSTPKYPWLKRETDDRNDHNIATAAAWCDVLVTDDTNFLARLGFLRSSERIFFEPMSLREFLAG